MKHWYEKTFDSIKSVWTAAFPKLKSIWSAYGYYISLACLLTIFGLTAYMYRSGNDQPYEDIPEESAYTQAMARLTVTAEPTPAPTLYVPVFTVPVSGEITNEYSPNELIWNDTLGQWIVHNGTDFSANAGTVVTASENGVISAMYSDDLWGNVIEITHDSDWITRYCSLDTMTLVEIGQTVSKGDVISSVGVSAIAESADSSHLHFEVLHIGEYVRPVFE